MPENVCSRFSIASKNLDSAYLSHHFSWRVTEAIKANEEVDYNITAYDLGVGNDTRVYEHLNAAKQALLAKETELGKLSGDCSYALWVYYDFSKGDGAFNLDSRVMAAFAFLRVDIVFHLNEE